MHPLYDHDCAACLFVGHLQLNNTGEDGDTGGTGGTGDVYVCPNSPPTILLRYSSDPPDYSSMAVFPEVRRMFDEKYQYPLAQAYFLAQQKRLIR